MKLSVFTVCTPDLTPDALIEAARESGIAGIEWRYASTPAEVRGEAPSFWRNNICTLDPQAVTDEQLDTLRDQTIRFGLEAVTITPYLTCGDLSGTERAMRHAVRLGAKAIRVGVPRYDRSRRYPDLFAEAVDYLQAVEELSARYGVKGLVETHHVTIAPSASLAYRLVERFSPERIGVLYDPGNMVHEGYENYRMGLELLGPYLAHVHVKNAGWFPKPDGEGWECRWAAMDRGIVDWKQVVADLKAVGYDGWYGVEDFSGTHSSRTLLREFVGWFRSLAGESAEVQPK